MEIEEFRQAKKSVSLPQGQIAYADLGAGPVALFVHGVFMNSLLWRNVISELRNVRRCIAIDLPAHGDTQTAADLDLSLHSHADLLADFLDALGIDQVDLVGNDTGGALVQLLAVRHTPRVRSLTLTNCDVHDNFPPDAFKAGIELARQGQLAPLLAQMVADLDLARSESGLGLGYEHPESITPAEVQAYLGRYTTPEGGREIERRVTAIDGGGLTEIEEDLKKLDVPTLVVWGTDDKFFDLTWAHWLRDTIPGAEKLVEIQGGKLFFVDERAAELAREIAWLWSHHPAPRTPTATKGGS